MTTSYPECTHVVPGTPRAAGIGRRSLVALAGLIGAVMLISGLGGAITSAAAAATPSYAWATKAGGKKHVVAKGVSALPDGSSIITGYFTDTATFGATSLISAGFDDTFTAKVNANGTYVWAIRGGSGTYDDYANGVSALPDGSSIITGQFSYTATFGSTTLRSDDESADTFTAKVNANGTYAWATRGGGPGYDGANGVSALPDGSSIITGFFSGTATFGGTTLTSAGSDPVVRDIFTAKVNADGTYAWATRGGGTGGDEARGVSALPDGSSIITGEFRGTATFGATTFTSAGPMDTFTAKVNADGTYAWATKGGGTDYDQAWGVSALPDGSSIITGNFAGTATFGATILISDNKEDHTFTAKVNADGTYAWATKVRGTGYDGAKGVSALPDGSSIITGDFTGTATFGATTFTSAARSSDTFTAKVNADGTYAWVIRGVGTGYVQASGVSALPDGSIIITGHFSGSSVTFGATSLISTGLAETFTARILADAPQAPTGASASAPVNTFTIKPAKSSATSITTQLNLPGPGKVVQVGTTPLPKTRASSQMAKRARTLTVCTADKTVAKAGTVTITCRLTAKARAARKTHSLKVRLVTTFTPAGGTAKSVSTTLVLKKTR